MLVSQYLVYCTLMDFMIMNQIAHWPFVPPHSNCYETISNDEGCLHISQDPAIHKLGPGSPRKVWSGWETHFGLKVGITDQMHGS